MTKTVEFFYDFTSPTAYLAWARLPAIAERTGATIRYRPMFLGGVMQATGNRPPGTLPQKGAWMAADLARWAKRFNTPYKPNPHFPMMTLMVQRAAQEWVDRPDFDKYLAAIFTAAWRDQKNIADKAVLAEVLTAAGFSQEEFFAATENPANKEKLKATTDEAVARGVFGAPTFFVDGEMHFGQDRLDFVEEALLRS
jgi:2-hydroxychromene-2-carboxylate isomerase